VWDWSKAPRSFNIGSFTLRPLGPNGRAEYGTEWDQVPVLTLCWRRGNSGSCATFNSYFVQIACLPLHFTLLPANWNDILSTPIVIKQVKGLKRTQSYSAGSVPNINRLLNAARPTVWSPMNPHHSLTLSFRTIRFNITSHSSLHVFARFVCVFNTFVIYTSDSSHHIVIRLKTFDKTFHHAVFSIVLCSPCVLGPLCITEFNACIRLRIPLAASL
jgi:hypothetical protein